jgi:hypothetical protein
MSKDSDAPIVSVLHAVSILIVVFERTTLIACGADSSRTTVARIVHSVAINVVEQERTSAIRSGSRFCNAIVVFV